MDKKLVMKAWLWAVTEHETAHRRLAWSFGMSWRGIDID